MIVNLPYGRDRIALDLRGLRVRSLMPSAPTARGGSSRVVGEALERPLEGPCLAELARGRHNATVIVPDATRRAALPEVLPQVLDRLRRGGIGDSSVTILVACGTHPRGGPEAMGELLGSLPAGVQVVEHDCRDPEALSTVGDLRPGLPLRLHRKAVESDLLITVGSVRHHYFAGFGGGPKMVFPGVGGYEEIQANHSLVLRLEEGVFLRHPRCEPGVLEGNPVAEEIARAADLRSPDCALCLIEDCAGGITWGGAGPWRVAFAAAVEKMRSWYEIPPGPPCELMVACGGGAPTDETLIQAHKGLDAACRFLAPGGEILYLAALDGGAGSEEMQEFLDDPRPQSILRRLSERWVQYGHTTFRLVEKTTNFRTRLHSHLDPELALRLGFEPAPDPEVVVEGWRQRNTATTVGVMVSGAVYPAP